jgi:hypothetical protein
MVRADRWYQQPDECDVGGSLPQGRRTDENLSDQDSPQQRASIHNSASK